MFRKQILENAIRTVCQDRSDKYGQIEDNFGLIADIWSSYLGASVTAVDVAMMMGMLKMARIKTGKYTQDNFVDLAGYAACGAEAAELDASKKQEETLQRLEHVKKLIAEREENHERIDQRDTPPERKRGKRTRKLDVAKIKSLHNAGWSAAKIADELNCATGTVYLHLKRMRAENEEGKENKEETAEIQRQREAVAEDQE